MISVITITFNNYEELIQTTNSLIGVENIEHIIINGGKCEKTLKFLNEEFKGVSISEPDKGISDAFSKGARLASGKAIAYLNSGDIYIGKNYYSLAEELLIANPDIDFIHSNLLFKDTLAGELIMRPTMSTLGSGMPYFHPTMVVRKSVFDRIGYFSLDKKIGMDFDFVCKMEKANMKGKYLDGFPVVLMDGSGVSATQEQKALKECLDSLKTHGLYNAVSAKDFYLRMIKLQIRLFLIKNFPNIMIRIKRIKHS